MPCPDTCRAESQVVVVRTVDSLLDLSICIGDPFLCPLWMVGVLHHQASPPILHLRRPRNFLVLFLPRLSSSPFFLNSCPNLVAEAGKADSRRAISHRTSFARCSPRRGAGPSEAYSASCLAGENTPPMLQAMVGEPEGGCGECEDEQSHHGRW